MAKQTGQKLDRFKLKEALLASMKDKNKATPVRPFDLIRSELLSAFHSAFLFLETRYLLCHNNIIILVTRYLMYQYDVISG